MERYVCFLNVTFIRIDFIHHDMILYHTLYAIGFLSFIYVSCIPGNASCKFTFSVSRCVFHYVTDGCRQIARERDQEWYTKERHFTITYSFITEVKPQHRLVTEALLYFLSNAK